MPNTWNEWLAPLALVVGFLIWFAIRQRVGRKPYSSWTWWEQCVHWSPYVAIIILPSWLENAELNTRYSLAILITTVGVLMLASGVVYGTRQKELQQSGLPNPLSSQSTSEPPAGCALSVPLSREEQKLSIRVPLALLLVVGIVTAITVLLAKRFDQPGLALAFVVTTLLYVALGRWPGTMRLVAVRNIAADPDQVWNTIAFQPNQAYYRATVAKVERIGESERELRLHYHELSTCSDCGLPRNPDVVRCTCRVSVVEQTPPTRYTIHSRREETPGDVRWIIAEEEVNTFHIERIRPGQSQITLDISMRFPRIMTWALLQLGDPAGELLDGLKAHLENSEDESIFGVAKQRLVEARQAPLYCGCNAGREAHIGQAPA